MTSANSRVQAVLFEEGLRGHLTALSQLPVLDLRRQKLFQSHSVTANQKRPGAFVFGCERIEPGLRQRRDSTLHFDSGERHTKLENEIHFPVSISPVEQRSQPRCGRVREVGADRRLDKPSPAIAVGPRLFERQSRECVDETGVDECRLSNLTRPRNNLNEPPRLLEPFAELKRLRALKRGRRFTRHDEKKYSVR